MRTANRWRSGSHFGWLLAGLWAVVLTALPASVALAQSRGSEPPDQPQGLQVVVSHDLVRLSWDDPGDATISGYQILRRLRDHSPVGVFEVLIEDTGSAATSYVDRQVQPATRYNYRIKARNAAGLSQRSNFIRADTAAEPAEGDPGAPSDLTAELAAGGGLALRWQAPAEDAESVSGYQLLRRRPFRGEQTLLSYVADTGSAATSFDDVNANEPGEQYVYRVVALRGAEPSGWSNLAQFVVPQADPAEQAPSNLSARLDVQGIALSWAAPAANAETVTGYRLLRAVANSAMSILDADTGSDTTTYFDSSATTPGETYRYQVLAVRDEQASQSSNTVTVSVPESLIAGQQNSVTADPTVPGNLVTTFSDDHISLQWTTPVLDGDSVTGYQILRRDEGSPLSILAANTNSVATTYEDREITQGANYSYAVKAWRGVELSERSEFAPAESCDAEAFNTTPLDVPVSVTPIVVESTAADYFVLFVRPDLNEAPEIPISITLGADGATTLTEQLPPLPIAHYRVEQYPVDDPADLDRDCISDIVELADLGALNPLNRAREIEIQEGAVAIPDRDTFERLSYQGDEVLIDHHLKGLEFVKFFVTRITADRPAVYFMNTVTYRAHYRFVAAVPFGWAYMKGEIVYHPNVIAADGSLGVYRFEFEPNDDYPFSAVQYAYEVLAASMPVLENNLAYYPMPNRALPRYHREKAQYDESRVKVVLESDIFPDVDFISLNHGTGYGILRAIAPEDRPNPRDVVIYESLPNDLPRVAGIITTVPQTPLSHVNLRAIQDRIPNAFIRDALNEEAIDSLIDTHVRYEVTGSGYTIRAATRAEVDAHHDASRPSEMQTPERDLTVTEITALSDVSFDDWTAFGVKAANVAVLGSLGFPDGTVPDGYAVPFYFYDEFMKANDLDTDVATMLDDTNFQTDFDTQEDELKKLRNKIKDATTPDWIITALEDIHDEFPEGTSLRYRSSTNNEDLPGFSGAGLYDSKTQDPDETEDDGIDKSIKGVWASLWSFRAFVERDFHRIDHNATAMGVLVHPNYSDELANGVAVSYDPFSHREGAYYLNTQIGEDLVTNPEANSVPEALLLLPGGSYEVLVRSNQVEANELLMSDTQLQQLRSHLSTIHDHFKTLYDPAEDERFAMEIEYKITSDNVLAIKQARPWVFRPINEPPAFPTTETGVRTIAEGTPRGTDIGSPVAATDPEGDTVTYSLGGLHADQFRIQAPSGQLRTWGDLDYEGVNTYEVEVTAGDVANPEGATITVQIMLTNEEDPGALELLPVQPLVGTPLTATLTDPDGGITSQSWSWQRSPNGSSWTSIANATGGHYVPVDADLNHYLRVTVRYTDGHGSGKEVEQVSDQRTATNNRPPAFNSSAMERSVPENSTAGTGVGAPVLASDPDGDTLSYELSGDANFTIDSGTGQIQVAGRPALNHEQQSDHNVSVKAIDPSGAFATAGLTVTVVDVNDPPVFADQSVELEVARDAEAGDKVGAPVTATDDDGDDLTYGFVGNGWPFEIDPSSGQVGVRADAPFDPELQDRYTVTVEARDSEFSAHMQVTIKVAEQLVRPTPGGGTGGGGGGGPSPSPSVIDFEWTVTRDIDALDSGHDKPSGQWSDGETLWLLENGDGSDDAVYAYDLATGERVEGREFEMDDANRAPRGVWSDRTLLWVSDSGRNRLFAHDLASGERLPERDVALTARNRAARGIWSGDGTMWVLDGGKDSVFAYDLASGALMGEYELASTNGDPHGIWSDGVTVWVSDHGAKRLFAYRLPARPEAPAVEDADRQDLERVRDEEFPNTVLSRASNNSPRGLWSDGDVMYVADESDGKVYSYNMPDAIDARLASLSLSGVDIGEFSPKREEYEGVAADDVTATTVEAQAAYSGASVVIDPPDADQDTDGHQATVEGGSEITVTVTSEDASRIRSYHVRLGEAGPSATCLRGAVAIGFSLVVYEGGGVDDLVACAQSRHITTLYALTEGAYVPYILRAPDFVNQQFREVFPDGVPAATPLVASSSGPPSADPFADAAVSLSWPECLRGEVVEGFSLVVYEGGSVEGLESCVRSRNVTAVYALAEGEWVPYILRAPDFVNLPFRALYPDGLPPMTALVIKSDEPQDGEEN